MWLRTKSPVQPVGDQQAGEQACAPDAAPSSGIDRSDPWPLNISTMDPVELQVEVIDHVRRLRSEVSTLRAEVNEFMEGLQRVNNLKMPPYFQPKDAPIRYYQDRG